MPQNSVPTDIAHLKDIWPDYTYAQDFPPEMAHRTGNGIQTSAWTCTPTTASVNATSTTTESSGAAPTINSPNGTTDYSTTAEAEGRRALISTAAMIAAAAGLAVFL